ncbi:MAG: hypothetical protein JWQ18_2876 [Conexibacter sp.]|nr:hypothetical protein [Conexibacter sp.]
MADPFKPTAPPMREALPMTDIAAAAQFVHGHGRLLERRRFDHLFGPTPDAGAVLRALDAYRNADGGVGFLEPDLRTPASQPSAVLYAFEVLDEVGETPRAFTHGALDWLQTVTNPDGGVPFVLPTAQGWPHAPWWAPTEDPPSSLLMTAGVASVAHRLHLEDHPWVAKADDYLWEALGSLSLSDPYAFRYAVHFLDAVPDRDRATTHLDQLRERLPEDGRLTVEAGTEGETLSALEVAPRPGHAGAVLFPQALIEQQLDELQQAQQPDGGWDFSWAAWNPAVAFEWRGMVTLDALTTLRAYGRLD